MKVFVFDLLAYDANLDHLKDGEPELPYPLAGRHFDADTAVRTYEEHLDAWEALDRFGYDGVGFNEHHCSPYGLMNSPNLMAAVGGAAHQEPEAADLRQSVAGAPAAAPRRGTGDDRLPVEGPADLRLRPRHPARIPGAQRAARRVARPLRGSLRHHHPRLDRGGVLLRGPVLVVQGCRAVAAPGAAAAPADLDPGRRQQGIDRVRRQRTIARSPRASAAPAACATTSSAITRNASAQPGTASRPNHLSLGITAYVADSKAQALEGIRAAHPLFQPHPVQPRQFHRDRDAARRPAIRARPRPITCGRKTCAPRPICARNSAT